MRLTRACLSLWCVLFFCFSTFSHGSQLTIAVASNFKGPMSEIVDAFEQKKSVKTVVVYSSSGKHFAQIKHSAPFDVFLSADQAKPIALEKDNLIIEGSRFTYAVGAIVLWRNSDDSSQVSQQTLLDNNFNKLAIANPKLAPYGDAAQQLLINLGVFQTLKSKLVRGENIAQVYQFVKTGNAELGLIASAQVNDSIPASALWYVPKHLYPPIKQDAVILKQTKNLATAKQFMHFLTSDTALTIMANYGYQNPTGSP